MTFFDDICGLNETYIFIPHRSIFQMLDIETFLRQVYVA